MHCRSCNTRAEVTDRHCPNCGRVLRPSSPPEARPRPARPGEGLPPTRSVPAYGVTQPMPSPRVDPPAPPTPSDPAVVFTLAPDELRAQIAERPELVERGLRPFRDAQGHPVGVGYETEVGSIDLLGEDVEGRLVVVMVAETGADPVADVLARVGWVSKHLGGKERGVRAIVLLEPPPPALGYAARAVAGTISFRTYRVVLRFEEIRG